MRRDALEAERGGQDLDAAVDLVRAERDAAAAGAVGVRSPSTAWAKAPTSKRMSSRRPPALVFEARTRTRSCPAGAVGVMSPQTRLAISERRSPAQNARATIAASRRPAGRGGRRRFPPTAAALGPAGRLHQCERRSLDRSPMHGRSRRRRRARVFGIVERARRAPSRAGPLQDPDPIAR